MRRALLACAMTFVLLGCGRPVADVEGPQTPVAGMLGLADSLARLGGCPRGDLPPIRVFQDSENPVSEAEICGFVTAALRRLAARRDSEPVYARSDTARVRQVILMIAAWKVFNADGRYSGVTDSIVTVNLDIPGRAKLVGTEYRGGGWRESFGTWDREAPPE
ncbi:MAG: hypothetical protein V4558_13340 [Gemmatimonadota bacterium]